MKRSASLAAAASLTAGVLALSACGGGNSAASGNAHGPVTLTFQSLSDQPAAIQVTKDIVGKWNADNPDVQVKIVPAGWDSIYDKLITQFNGGSAPDIIHYEAAGLLPFAEDGFLADLSHSMPDDFKKSVPKGVMDSVTVNHQVVGYPTELQTYMVFANRTLLQQAGVQIPTGDTMTWDQLRQIAAATTKNGVYGLGWGLKSPTAAFMAMSPGFGGKFFKGSGANAQLTVGNGELALPKLVHDMTYDDKSISPVTLTQSGSDVLPAFYGGQVAMTVQGSFQAANIAKDAPAGFDWVALPPLKGSESAGQAANPQTLSVNVDSKHVKESTDFLNFFTEPENLAALNTADALIPATSTARDQMAQSLGGKNGWNTILSSGDDLVSAPYLFVDKYAQWKDTVATPAFQKYLAKQTDTDGLKAELTDGWRKVTG